jgi:serine/threonine protein kinase
MLALAPHCPPELHRKAEWRLTDFVLVKKLGVGGASAVYKAFLQGSSNPVALKMYFKSKMTPLNVHQVHREVMIHAQLDHPNIIGLVRAAPVFCPCRKSGNGSINEIPHAIDPLDVVCNREKRPLTCHLQLAGAVVWLSGMSRIELILVLPWIMKQKWNELMTCRLSPLAAVFDADISAPRMVKRQLGVDSP